MEPSDSTARPPWPRARPAAALWLIIWLLAALGWIVASGAALRYAQTAASGISTTWMLIALACTAIAVFVDLLTRRARGTSAGAVIACAIGVVIAGLSLGFAVAQAVLVSRGHAEPKGYVLTLVALIPTAVGALVFLLPSMVRRSRTQRARDHAS